MPKKLKRKTGIKLVSTGSRGRKPTVKVDRFSPIIKGVDQLSKQDVIGLHKSERSYGDSWKQRGGVGAFMMLARKWDRIEKQVENYRYDIFDAMANDKRPEGLLDDIRDLRRYLFLVDSHMCGSTPALDKDFK